MAKSSYNVDHLGKFEHLGFFESFISEKPFHSGLHKVYIEIDATEANTAQSLHPFVDSVLSQLDALDRSAKEKLRTIHNPTEDELSALTLGGLFIFNEKEFEFRYPLPEGEAVEYLSVKFCEQHGEFQLVDTSFGNF